MRIKQTIISNKDVSTTRHGDMRYFQNKIAEMLQRAASFGVVITVSNPPNKPLAMGNYDLVVDARPLRNHKDYEA